MSLLGSEEQITKIVYIAPSVESLDDSLEKLNKLDIEVPKAQRKKQKQEINRAECDAICMKYASMSSSSVFRHPYYKYPAVLDPGISEALLEPEEEVTYPNDGQQIYLVLCEEMNQCPVRSFYKGLLTDSINLKYYGVNPFGVRAMALALRYNKNVTVLDFTDNNLNNDACFHLGEMLMKNYTLRELNMSGCKIGALGAKSIFSGLAINKGIKVLNLNKNDLGDDGVKHLANIIKYEIVLEELYLSHNNITGKALDDLAKEMEIFNKFTVLDISWNNLFSSVNGTVHLLLCLSENTVLKELDLSWNYLAGERVGAALNLVLKCPQLRRLNLSHNKLEGEAVENVIGSLRKAKNLVTFDLSNNPLSPEDAIKVMKKVKLKTAKVQNVLMDGVYVNTDFLLLLKEMKSCKKRMYTVVTYGDVDNSAPCKGPDMRDVVLNRAEYLTKSVKKKKIDIVLWAMQLLNDEKPIMPAKTFADFVNRDELPINDDLVDEIVSAFPGTQSKKAKTISVANLVDYMKRKWPDRKFHSTLN